MVRTYDSRVDVYRGGAYVTTLKYPAGNEPQITAREEAAVKTGMTGTFLPNDKVDWLTDELRAYQIIDGVEHPCGVFHVATVSEKLTEFGKTLSVQAYDKCYLAQSATAETSVYFRAGTSYINCVEQMMTQAGIGLRIIEESRKVLATDREDWETGTSLLAVINQLLGEINYQQLWFDENGYAILAPKKEPSAENIKHRYDGTDIRSVLAPEAAAATDIWGKPNVFIAICQNPDMDAPMVAKSVNDNQLSALSTVRRGRRIAQVYKVDNVPDQATLQFYADSLRGESMLSAETLTISTANMPGHGIGDTVAVRHPQIEGIYREIGWKMKLAPGALMQHDLQRKVLI